MSGPVSGEGPQPARGMIVGEAPGRDEVEQGRPFVGRSGRLLDTSLRAVGVERSGVYITNAVKALPLDGDEKIRRPTPEEIAEWYPILQGEIENTAPAAILALGQTAAGVLTDLVGEKIPFGSKIGNVYVAWHPSYVQRSVTLHPSYVLGSGNWAEWLDQIRPWALEIRAA